MLKEKNKFIATILAFAMIPMSGLATDIYLPSMPSMATELHQPESNIQLTLSIFLISYGLTQFFAGSIVDSFTLKKRNPFHVKFLIKEYDSMFRAKDFFYGMIMCGISYSMIMFFNLCGSFIIEHKMGYSEVVAGYVSLILGFAWMAGGFLGKALINKAFLPKIRYANFIQLFLIVLMFVASYFSNSIYSLVAFAFVIHVTAGFIFNNYFSYCIGRFPNSAGLAGGMTGGVVFIITSAISYGIVAVIKPQIQLEVAEGYFVMGALGLFILSMIKWRKAHV